MELPEADAPSSEPSSRFNLLAGAKLPSERRLTRRSAPAVLKNHGEDLSLFVPKFELV